MGSMDIGDGLTIQTRSVNGKLSTGIFLAPSNIGKAQKSKFSYKSKTAKYPLRSRVEPTQTEHKIVNRNKPKDRGTGNAVTRSLETKQTIPESAEVQNKQQAAAKKNKDKSQIRRKDDDPANDAAKSQTKKNQGKPNVSDPKKLKNAKNSDIDSENVDTKFVTLTQDQLNTILSLVKTKHDIDVSTVLTEGDKDPEKNGTGDPNTDNQHEKDPERVEPDSIPGLDIEPKEGDSDKKDEKAAPSEEIANLIKKGRPKSKKGANKNKEIKKDTDAKSDQTTDDASVEAKDESTKSAGFEIGALGGIGTRERDKSKLEAKRQEWIRGLEEQVKHTEQVREEKRLKRKGSEKQPVVPDDYDEETKATEGTKPAENRVNKPKQPAHSAPPSAKMSARVHNKVPPIPTTEFTPVKRSQENLPAAIRSSFFIGEAAPREHAFSARKREQQQKWREELDKQRTEQHQRKVEEKKLLMRLGQDDEGTAWTRHFDTMLPTRNSIQNASNPPQHHPPQHQGLAPFPSTGPSDLRSASDSQVDNATTIPPEMSTPRESAGVSLMNNIYHGEHTTAAPGGGSVNYDQQRTSYLRTMTSLLDPAQIEALEVKRRKQEEHRRAIGAQVEERKRKKEEEDNLRKRMEMEEDMRLAAERDVLTQKNETERMKHQMRENVQEQRTQELYHQMQEAQESALRDKLSKREQKLRDRGHDTSRLEKTHQMTLGTKKKVVDSSGQLMQPSQASIQSTSSSLQMPAMNLPSHGFSTNATPRQAFTSVYDRSPVSVMADTANGQIQLQITLNNQQNQNELVETGVQTEMPLRPDDSSRRLIYDSDQDTEYLPLPQVKSKKTKPQRGEERKTDKRNPKQSLQKYEKNLGKQYDRFSRAARNQTDEPNIPVEGNPKQKRNERKPQWGVGVKKKEFVPASKRYVDNAKWQRRHEANIRRREEQLLEQQAMNNPERLRVIATQMRENDHVAGDGRSSPPVPTIAHRTENANNARRTRSYSPQKKDTTQDYRSHSPPVPGATRRWQKQKEQPQKKGPSQRNDEARTTRPESAVSATTEQAKYKGNKHTRDSPIPQTSDYVEYRRTSTILNPNQVESRPTTGVQGNTHEDHPHQRNQPPHSETHDPLLNPNMIRQRDRQEQILREISILRQGLLLKQREVASYPVGMTHSISAMPQSSLVLAGGGNLPERTNDTPLM